VKVARQLAFTGWLEGVDEPPGTDDWYTPPELVGMIADFFGGEIDLDPCASEQAWVQARVRYTKADDGLSMPWAHSVTTTDGIVIAIRNRFINPPYSNPRPWIERLADLHATLLDPSGAIVGMNPGDVGNSIALVKADPSTKAWARAWEADAVLFFRRRIQFARDRTRSTLRASAPFPSAMLYWGAHAEGFCAWFEELGHIVMKTKEQRVVEQLDREHADAVTAVDEPAVQICTRSNRTIENDGRCGQCRFVGEFGPCPLHGDPIATRRFR